MTAANRLPNGLRVFVVEDEALVLLNLETMLEDLGCVVVGPAMRFAQAEEMIGKGVAADVALLDVNLGGKPVFDLAGRLVETGMPIAFTTGYGRGGLPEEWQNRPVLQKPYSLNEVAEGLAAAIGV